MKYWDEVKKQEQVSGEGSGGWSLWGYWIAACTSTGAPILHVALPPSPPSLPPSICTYSKSSLTRRMSQRDPQDL